MWLVQQLHFVPPFEAHLKYYLVKFGLHGIDGTFSCLILEVIANP